MGDQNEATQRSRRDSILEEMDQFNFYEEGTIITTIIFDSSDTENDEPLSKSLPLVPTNAENTLYKTDTITNNMSCDYIDTEIKLRVEIKHENTPLNETGQNEILETIENNQITNQTSTDTVQSFDNLPCISATLEQTATDTPKRNYEDPNLPDSELKKQKNNFPRTKVTTRREVKKFAGKMESINKMQRVSEQNRPEPFTEYSLNCHENRLAINSGQNTPESEQRIIAALQIVAENLINISPYINRVSKNSKLNVKEFQTASAALFNAKQHFFALSYSTVASTIIPYMKESHFMEKFYNLTFQLAHQKGIPNTFSVKSLQALCSEMIKWTQMKMSRSKNDEMSRISVISNTTQINALETLNRQITSRHVQNTNYRSSDRDRSCKNTSLPGEAAHTVKDITLVFPAEHTNSAIKISYNPALTSQLSIPSQSCTNVNSNTTVQKNTKNYPVQQHMQPQLYPQTVQQQHQSPELCNLLQAQVNYNHQQGLQQRLQPLAMPPNVIRQNPHSDIRINSCYQLPSSPQTRTFSGSNIPNRLEPYYSSPGQYPQTDMTLQRASSYGHQQMNQFEQSDPSQRNFLRLNNCPQERSSSRDSGFFSPVQDAYQQDCQILSPSGMMLSPPALPPPPPYSSYSNNTNQQAPVESRTIQQQQNKIPATSIFRNCTVCKTLTTLTCLGCSNTYYCGDTCQNMDWNYHSKYCRKT